MQESGGLSPSKPTSSANFKEFLTDLGRFATGLFALSVLVFVLATLMGRAMISADGYMAPLTNFFSLLYFMPILLLLFGAIAYGRKDWVFVGYPLAVFFIVGPIFIESSIAQAIGLQLPFLLHNSNTELVAVLMSYGFLFTLEWSFSRLVRRGRFKDLPPSRVTNATSYFLIGAVVVAAISLPFITKTIMRRVAYERAAVRAPQTQEIATFLGTAKDQELHVQYVEATEQYAGLYRMTDRVAIWPIKQGKSRKSREACGGSIKVLAQWAEVQYYKTASGFEYGIASEATTSSSDPSRKTKQFTDYRICFAIDNKIYILERDDRSGTDHLKKYPADLVVDAFYKAKRVTSTPRLTPVGQGTYDEGLAGVNPGTYEITGYLDVPEWGIRLPLTTMTKDAYYAKSLYTSWLLGGLRSKTDAICTVKPSRSGNEDGLFSIVRKSKAEAQAEKEKYSTEFGTPHKTIGDYLYAVSPNGFAAKKCFASTEEASGFEDVLDWATVNIRPL